MHNPTISKAGFYASFLSLLVMLVSCANNSDANIDPNVLVKVDKATLTRQDLQANLPSGLSTDDSVKLAKAYIKSWIDSQLASQVAAKEIDLREIDKMVEQYRNELIMFEYGRRMYAAHASEIPEDSLKTYYDQHKSEFVLSRPMVKGVYLKVAEDSKSLPQLRKIYRSQKSSDIDNLDKSELNGAVHYDYFRDKWIDWEQIESRIPYDFDNPGDAFLTKNSNLDYTLGGFTYLLDITDVIHTGETMPYEAARSQIIDRLQYADRRNYDLLLRKNLYENALSKGKLSIFCDLNP